MLHRAVLPAPSLPPPKNGSLRQAALTSVQRLQTVAALPVINQSTKKRPLPDSPNGPSPLNLPPLAQRIRKDIQLGESEVESPEKEVLRSPPFPENSPAPLSPCSKSIPSPTHLVFTPVPQEDDVESPEKEVLRSPPFPENSPAALSPCSKSIPSPTHLVFTPVPQEDVEDVENESEHVENERDPEDVETESDLEKSDESNWEDVESDVESEDWAEEFTNSIRRFHGLNPDSSQGGVVGKSDREDVEDERDLAKAVEGKREQEQEQQQKCWNCDAKFSPHQCFSEL